MNWQKLSNTEQLEAIKESSNNPDLLGILIFKHSTRCATSAMALYRIEKSWSLDVAQMPTFFLDILSFRQLSDFISSTFGIPHQSPQALVIKDGLCIYDNSHMSISTRSILKSVGLDNM
ncbi:MAG: bacillithiol system redox-active protein YtxJ [Flavobacteriales bacterium]|nr:bacillithiol system redox-active protein YtxJ [Flavobacteriales bacterium]